MTKPRFRRHADGETSLVIGDGFANMLTGLGHFDLKASANNYVMPVPDAQLEAAYRTSTWFGKIVDIPAHDATREWRAWKGEQDHINAIDAEERRLGIQQKVLQAIQWQRLYGGAAIFWGGLPGDLSQPVPMQSIRRRSVAFATVLPKSEITASGDIVRNPQDPSYGRPEYFTFSGSPNVKIHPSRVSEFRGRTVSSSHSGQDYWGDPIWFSLEAAVKSADASGAVIDALLQEAKVDVMRVSGMTQGLANAEYEAIMIRRFQLVALLKGMQNVMLLDKDDEWSQKQITWTGLPDIGKHILNILSGASDIPMFRLTGQNLTGLSNSGDAEQRAYYDGVRAKQKLILQPSLTGGDEILIRSALGSRPDSVWYDWVSLYQMTEKEKAEIDKMEADTASVYASSGLIPQSALEKAVQSRMIESGRWGGLEQALIDAENEPGEDDGDDDAEILALLAKAQQAQAGNGDDGAGDESAATGVSDAIPRTLYVSRKVTNAVEIIKWAKANGFDVTTKAADMHVTIMYATTPIDWMTLPEPWDEEITVNAGGPRVLDRFGDDRQARVLRFKSSSLDWRFRSLVEAGARPSRDEYEAHITLSWSSGLDGDEADWPAAYQGKIKLGPEIWEEIKEDWRGSVTEDGK